jgi:hypothetical protein
MTPTPSMLIRFSAQEAAHIRAMAKAQAVSQTAYVRELVRREMKKDGKKP